MKGSLVKRSANSWSIALYTGRDDTGKKKYKWHTVQGTKREAESELARLLHEMNTGAYVNPSRDTLEAFLKGWLDTVKPNLAGKTYERYKEIVEKRICPEIGRVALSKLKPMAIQAFYSKMLTAGRKKGEGGLSAQTVLHFHRVLRQALQQGVRWQLLARNPADAVESPKPERKEMCSINAAETAWLLEVAKGTRFYIPVLLAITTGMRRGEFLALRRSDVNLETGTAAVNRSVEQTKDGIRFKSTKGKKGRPVVLPAITVAALKEHFRAQDQQRKNLADAYQDPGLIVGRDDGALWPPDTFSADFANLAEKAGLKVRLHDLRHSHATHLLGQGVHPKIVSERLGHSTVSITLDLYSHVLPGMQEDAAQKVDAVLRAAIEKQQAAKPT